MHCEKTKISSLKHSADIKNCRKEIYGRCNDGEAVVHEHVLYVDTIIMVDDETISIFVFLSKIYKWIRMKIIRFWK